MSRLIVRNSSLVYPPVPDEILREADVVLPLVDRFDDAVFMAGPGLDALRERFPAFNTTTRSLAREIAAGLPDWLGRPSPRWGHSVWDAYADHFAKFSLGPIRANAFLAERAIEANPDEVLGWELDSTAGWWAGRQMVAEIACAIGQACNAPVELSASPCRRVFRDVVLPGLRIAQILRHFRQMRSLNLPPPEEPVDVLFVVAGPTLVPMYDRIGARLQSDHGLRVLALDTPLGGPWHAIAEGQLPRSALHGFSDRSVIAAGIADALAAAQSFAETAHWLREWHVIRDLPEALQDVLERRLRATVISELPVCRCNARLWERALDALQPRVLVSFNSYNEVLAPGVLQARHRGIPTVCLQHGIWGPLFQVGALLPHDDVMIFGDYALEMLSPLATAHTRFIKAGHSMYDDLDLSVESAPIRSDFIGEREHLVVVTTQPIEARLMRNEQRWWLRGLAEACAQADATLAIKPHPHEDADLLERYEALSAEMPETVRVAHHGQVPLRDLIAASDLLVTRFSTTAFEAALLGRPVMTINPSGGPDQYPFAEEGGAVGVYEYEQIAPTLRALLDDQPTRLQLLGGHERFLARHLGPRDGRATKRIAARIAERASEN